MKHVYQEKDLKRLLCGAFNVKSMYFDNKKKELVIELDLPDTQKLVKEKLEKIRAATLDPTAIYQ